MADIFISYSRRDSTFADSLRNALVAQGRSVWVDTADIMPTSEWRQDIIDAIEAASAVLFVLSPDWVASEVSQRELQYAVEMKKKLIPVVFRDVDHRLVNPSLANLNWIFARPTDDPNRALQQILFAIDADLVFWREGSDLLVKARQWEQGQRNPTFTLRGEPLRKAEQWLASSATKNASPSALQVEYITAGRRASARRQRVTISALSVGIVVTLVLSVVAGYFAYTTNHANQLLGAKAIAANALSALNTNDTSRAVLLADEAYQLSSSDPITRGALFSTLSTNPHLVSVLQSNDLGQLSLTDTILNATYSADGKTLMTVSLNNILLWDMTTNRLRRTITGETTFRGALSADGQLVAAQNGGESRANVIMLWNATTGAQIGELDGTLNETDATNSTSRSIAFSPNGTLIAATDCVDTSCKTHRILVWDVASHHLKYQIPVPLRPTQIALSFSPDSRYLAFTVYQDDKTASNFTIWNIAQQHALFSHTGAIGEIYDTLTFTPHGKDLLVAGKQSNGFGAITDWDIASQQPSRTPAIDPNGNIADITISADNYWLVTATTFGEAQLWTRGTNDVLGPPLIKANISLPSVVAFSPVSDNFITASADDRLLLWSTHSFTSLGPDPVRTLFDHTRSAVSPDGKLLATTDLFTDQTVAIWDIATGALIKTIPTTLSNDPYTLTFSPDGHSLAVGGYNDQLCLLNIDTGTIEGQSWSFHDVPDQSIFPGSFNSEIDTIDFSADGRYLLATSYTDGVASLWDAHSHTYIAAINDKKNVLFVSSAAFATDGDVIFAGQDNNVKTIVGTWNVAQHAVSATWRYNKNSSAIVNAIAANPTANNFATTDNAGMITLWDATRHTAITRYATNQLGTAPGVLQFSSDGGLLLLNEDTTVQVLQVAGSQIEAYIQPLSLESLVFGALITPGSKYLVITQLDGVSVQYLLPHDWKALACAIANRNLSHDEWQQFVAANRSDVAYKPLCNLPSQ